MATILVLLSSVLPFLNNIIRNFFDTESIILLETTSTKKIDLDSAIFFFSMPISYAFIAFGGLFGAHKKSYYAVFLSCYLQLFLIVNYIFVQKNNAYIYTQIALFILFIFIGVIYFMIQKYYKNIELVVEYLNKTIDRYSIIIKRKTTNDEIDR